MTSYDCIEGPWTSCAGSITLYMAGSRLAMPPEPSETDIAQCPSVQNAARAAALLIGMR